MCVCLGGGGESHGVGVEFWGQLAEVGSLYHVGLRDHIQVLRLLDRRLYPLNQLTKSSSVLLYITCHILKHICSVLFKTTLLNVSLKFAVSSSVCTSLATGVSPPSSKCLSRPLSGLPFSCSQHDGQDPCSFWLWSFPGFELFWRGFLDVNYWGGSSGHNYIKGKSHTRMGPYSSFLFPFLFCWWWVFFWKKKKG